MEARTLDSFSPVQQADGNGNSIACCKADDTDSGEGIERSCRPEVDSAQNDLDDHGQHHGVEWDAQLWVNLLPQVAHGDGAIS